MTKDLTIRPLREDELATADRLFRRAFGTFLGLPDPETFAAGSDIFVSRWRADPARVFAAESDGQIVGSVVASNWGSLGFFGPLTVSPERWGAGVGQALMGAVMQQFATWGCRHLGLYTFAHSPKHHHLYEKFGFYPRFLTPVLSKTVVTEASAGGSWSWYSALAEGERAEALRGCREVADAVYDGLDLTREIEAVQAHRFGDTVLLFEAGQVAGFAVCHCGAGSEAGVGECYVKFGAVRPGAAAGMQFASLLSACEAFAAAGGMERVSAGVNLGCDVAYQQLGHAGYRTEYVGVAMQRPNEPGYNRPDRYVVSDWR